jgi:hypothetical protein
MATLVAPDQFSPVEDAEALRKACKGNNLFIYIYTHKLLHVNFISYPRLKVCLQLFFS